MRFRRTTLITAGCVSVLAGLGLARYLELHLFWWALLFAPALLLLKSKNLISLAMVILLGAGLGMWRGTVYMQKLAELKALSGQSVTLEVTAKTDAVYSKRSQIEFIGHRAELSDSRYQLAGNFKISGYGPPMVYRGDRVEVTGKMFPMRGSNQARIAYAKLSIVGAGNSWLDKLTRTFSAGMESALPEPAASFALGLLVGQRTNLPADIVGQLTAVGLVHIVAVSGYNLTILVRSVQRLKINSKYQKTILSMVLIISFVLVTGFSASIVRAAVISLLGLWAWYYGRNIKPINIILFAAALTATANPFYLWSDIGWYLSFLAFFGVLVVAPMVISKVLNKTPAMLTIILIETLAAEIMTLPLVMMIFGQMSIVALPANLLIVPLVPVAMLVAAVAAIAGAALPEAAGWLAWPANLLLTYILDLVRLLSGVPKAIVHIKIDSTLMICAYTSALIIMWTVQRRSKIKAVLIK